MFTDPFSSRKQTMFLTEVSLHACQEVVSRAGNICWTSNIFQKFGEKVLTKNIKCNGATVSFYIIVEIFVSFSLKKSLEHL